MSFFFSPEISRAASGNEKVSIRRGVHAPKFILKMSRGDTVKAFKAANLDCQFSVSCLLRASPQNCVLPTVRDFQRNVCPVISSCQLLSGEGMCSKEGLDLLNSSTWDKSCALNTCEKCPSPAITVPQTISQKKVSVPQWETRVSTTKKDKKGNAKKVNSLWPVELTLQQAVDKLKGKVPALKAHIYRAANQWKCCKEDLENLEPGTVLTIEDFQMNIEVQFFQITTSAFFGANQEQRAMAPMFIAFRKTPDSPVTKGGLVFISEDLGHDFHQVCYCQCLL